MKISLDFIHFHAPFLLFSIRFLFSSKFLLLFLHQVTRLATQAFDSACLALFQIPNTRLRADIKLEVLGHHSTSMTEVQALARFHEARLHARRYLGSTSGFKLPPLLPTPGLPSTGPKVQRSRPPPLEQQHPPANTATPVHRISSVEAQAHCQKGICYYCVD
ncbi:hypothetical protein PVK06_021024 [Gossypium arboreum]|uniref:Uncharacterized protein n=1 Tax=Gossypium arboreum TaxID=29729 RepID=A0ABR0PNX4_GOSAR|nr:hypothetical protein PVK06_021024 [Gossypium arboreum]